MRKFSVLAQKMKKYALDGGWLAAAGGNVFSEPAITISLESKMRRSVVGCLVPTFFSHLLSLFFFPCSIIFLWLAAGKRRRPLHWHETILGFSFISPPIHMGNCSWVSVGSDKFRLCGKTKGKWPGMTVHCPDDTRKLSELEQTMAILVRSAFSGMTWRLTVKMWFAQIGIQHFAWHKRHKRKWNCPWQNTHPPTLLVVSSGFTIHFSPCFPISTIAFPANEPLMQRKVAFLFLHLQHDFLSTTPEPDSKVFDAHPGCGYDCHCWPLQSHSWQF